MRIKVRKHLHIGILLIFTLLITFGCNFSHSVGIPKEPTSEDLQKLVKETLADFTEALEKDDFEIIRKKGATKLKEKYSATQMKQSLNFFVENKDKFVPLLRETKNMEAVFSPTPEMDERNENYFVNTEGKFIGQNYTIEFRIEYVREWGKWKPLKLWISPFINTTK
jgi:hypothetical protein